MNIRKQQGFTIIEVVLVLAIAGLIFLMVFIALPTLQTNQRDTQRRDDLSRFKAQINQYQANNKGAVPVPGATACTATVGFTSTNPADFVGRYLSGAFKDPASDNPYPCSTTAVTSASPVGTWYYATGQKCNGEAFTANAGARNYAVQMKLEGSGILCLDNL